MKKTLICLLLLTGILFAACDQAQTENSDVAVAISTEDSKDIESVYIDEESGNEAVAQTDNDVYNPYYFLSNNDRFVIAMSENPIDKYGNEVMKDLTTSKDMYDGLLTIFQLWETEMNATEAQLEEIITDGELLEEHMNSQKAWEEYVDISLRSDKSIITANSWGTEDSLMFISKRLNLYRERTIHLKYLIYLYGDTDTEVAEKALTFSTFE